MARGANYNNFRKVVFGEFRIFGWNLLHGRWYGTPNCCVLHLPPSDDNWTRSQGMNEDLQPKTFCIVLCRNIRPKARAPRPKYATDLRRLSLVFVFLSTGYILHPASSIFFSYSSREVVKGLNIFYSLMLNSWEIVFFFHYFFFPYKLGHLVANNCCFKIFGFQELVWQCLLKVGPIPRSAPGCIYIRV